MVERQYDLLKKEKSKNVDEPKTKIEENGPPSAPEPIAAPEGEQSPTSQENGHMKPEVS